MRLAKVYLNGLVNKIYLGINLIYSAISDFGLGDRIANEGGFIENTDALEEYNETAATKSPQPPQPTILMIPSAYRDGLLLSALPSDGSGDFTFGRGSLATRTNPQGLNENIEFVGGELISNGDFSQEGSEEVLNGTFQEGSELILNGDFSNGSTGFNHQLGWTFDNNGAHFENLGASNRNLWQSVLEVGKTYKLTFEITSISIGNIINANSSITSSTQFSTVGVHTQYFEASSVQLYLKASSDANLSIDNVSVVEVAPNWSFNNWSLTNNNVLLVNTSGYVNQTSVFVVGKNYKISIDVKDYTSGSLRVDSNGINLWTPSGSNTTATIYISNLDKTNFLLEGTFRGSITNISIVEVGQDWNIGSQWSIVNETAVLVGDGSPNSLQYSIAFELGKTYRVEFDVLALNGGAGKFQVQAGTAQTFSNVGSHSYDFTITNSPFTSIIFARGNGSINMTLDNISIKEITSATDMPRVNHDGTPHLLMEPTRTNLFVYSNNFATGWVKNSTLQVTENATVSPDGTLNAARIVKAGGGARLGQEVALTKDSTYTLSFYMKNNGGNASLQVYFNSQSTAQSYTINNDWARYEFTFTATSTETSQIRLFNGATDIDLFAFEAQFEVGSSATSSIRTNNTIKTRLQDVATDSGNSTLINSTEGVLYAEIATLGDGANGRYISICDGSLSNYVYIRITGNLNEIKMGVVKGGSTQASKSFIVPDLKQFNKLAISYQQDLFRFYVNGTLIFTDTNGDIFPIGTLNDLTFNLANTTNYFEGKVKELAFYYGLLTDAQLQELTTL